jgi:hypothetical protein
MGETPSMKGELLNWAARAGSARQVRNTLPQGESRGAPLAARNGFIPKAPRFLLAGRRISHVVNSDSVAHILSPKNATPGNSSAVRMIS